MRLWLLVGLILIVLGGVVCAPPSYPFPQHQQPPPDSPTTAPTTAVSVGDYGGWMTWEEIQAKIAEWQKKYPKLVHVTVLGKTVEGREIPLLRLADEITPNPQEPEILLIAGMHPREQAPIVCLMNLLDELLAGYEKDTRLTELLLKRQIWVVPMVNVDGKIYDMANGNGKDKAADWRKNRRKNADGSFGVDLNRNFAARWGGGRLFDETWRTMTTNTKGNIYEGTAPLSEPETRALADFMVSRPNLRSFMDIHSPLAVVLFPHHTVKSEYDRLYGLARGMQARMKRPYPIGSALKPDTEPAPGERGGNSGLTYTWAYYTQGVYSYNFELGTEGRETGVPGRYPTAESIEKEYRDNFREPLLYFLEESAKLPPAKRISRSLTPNSQPQIEGKRVPGATLSWKPPALIENWDWAVLLCESPFVVVQSEYRRFPLSHGFTLQIDETAKPGTIITLTLYVWDKDRNYSVHSFPLQISE